jgi:hypothetical protein
MTVRFVMSIVVLGSVAAGVGVVYQLRGDGEAHGRAVAAPFGNRFAAHRGPRPETAESALERLEHSIEMTPGTKRLLGVFELADGRSVRVSTAGAASGKACVIEEDGKGGPSAGCQENGLFGARRVAFSVHSDGGPGELDELYVVGVAAPDVRAVELVETDGRAVRLELSKGQAFLFQSTAANLAARVYPTALRLYGPSGRLLETVTFPSVG